MVEDRLMEKRLIRFVRRDTDNPDDKDGLIVGCVTRDGHDTFKRGYVYEIVDVLGEHVLREVGPSWIKPTIQSGRRVVNDGEVCEVKNNACWGQDVGTVLNCAGNHIILSEEEYLLLCGQVG